MKDKIMEEISTILHGNLITDEITEEQFICEEVIPAILPAIEAVIKKEWIERSKVARRLDEIYMKTGIDLYQSIMDFKSELKGDGENDKRRKRISL